MTFSRRHFLTTATAGMAGLGLKSSPKAPDAALGALGGKPVRTKPFPSWPVIQSSDESAWTEVLRRKKWGRGNGSYGRLFDETWAKTLGAKHCLAVANGTSALYISLKALGIGPGDEVLVPPYTFIATINVVLANSALPVFVDTDPETFQIDAGKIEAAITPRTRCILPVHLGGSSAEMDKILAVARKHSLPVIEDACQAHLAEWNHQKVSTLGELGCFSFQASKNLNSGEGGAIITQREDLIEYCESFHNNGRGFKPVQSKFAYDNTGFNLRITEFQAALLLAQLTRLEEQSRVREENARYLTSRLNEIPGIRPARMYAGCTRNAYHLYMFRYDKNHFAGVSRARFLEAMRAEGIPCSGGYTPLNKEPFLAQTLNSRGFRAIYSSQELAGYAERNQCPANDRLCEEAVWLTQTMLLGPREDMDQIIEAVRKIHAGAALLRS